MAEKSLLAYFHTPEQAEAAAFKLRALRAIDVSVDRFGRYAVTQGTDTDMNQLTGDFPSLGQLTLGADAGNIDANVLLAADPSASGMGGTGDEVTGLDVVLAAVVDSGIEEQARRVIRDCGGQI
jgi:hypothetical protein